MRSRVMPGSSVTMDRRWPIKRLNSVDFPTLGRPMIAMSGVASIYETFLKIARLMIWDLSCLALSYSRASQTPFVSLKTKFGKHHQSDFCCGQSFRFFFDEGNDQCMIRLKPSTY